MNWINNFPPHFNSNSMGTGDVWKLWVIIYCRFCFDVWITRTVKEFPRRLVLYLLTNAQLHFHIFSNRTRSRVIRWKFLFLLCKSPSSSIIYVWSTCGWLWLIARIRCGIDHLQQMSQINLKFSDMNKLQLGINRYFRLKVGNSNLNLPCTTTDPFLVKLRKRIF